MGTTIVVMIQYPVLLLFVYNFTTLTSLIVSGLTIPYKLPYLNRLELANECFILILNYHLFCLTDFVSDPDTREGIGYSMCAVTSLYLAINIGFALRDIFEPYFLKIKYFFIKRKKFSEKKKADDLRVK